MENYKDLYNRLMKESPDIRHITVKEKTTIQQIELEIMNDLIKVCDKYGLTILLGGGSCLGAVRHGGFIPWDDDMDFNIPRKDYEALKKVFHKELGDKYQLYAPNYDAGFPKSRFGKIEKKGTLIVTPGAKSMHECDGISVDLFPIEKIPSNSLIRAIHGFIVQLTMFGAGQVGFVKSNNRLLKKCMRRSIQGTIRLIFKTLLGNALSIYPLQKWFNLVDKYSQYNGKTELRGIPSGRKHYFGEIFPQSVYLPASETTFEGFKAYLPNNENRYLENLYGNYMQIPNESKREHHYISGLIVNNRRI